MHLNFSTLCIIYIGINICAFIYDNLHIKYKHFWGAIKDVDMKCKNIYNFS